MSFILHFIQNSSGLFNYLKLFFLILWLLKPSDCALVDFSESLF